MKSFFWCFMNFQNFFVCSELSVLIVVGNMIFSICFQYMHVLNLVLFFSIVGIFVHSGVFLSLLAWKARFLLFIIFCNILSIQGLHSLALTILSGINRFMPSSKQFFNIVHSSSIAHLFFMESILTAIVLAKILNPHQSALLYKTIFLGCCLVRYRLMSSSEYTTWCRHR